MRTVFARTEAAHEYCTPLEHTLAGSLRYHLVAQSFHGQDFVGTYAGGEIELGGTPTAPVSHAEHIHGQATRTT
ncbi:hypothetical protein [Nocardiopsis gilva]|uniref:hypothetical protein n=1 Tax=Nocardiopsis gilva TaxID=280236 RepID=UPI00034584B7|nr:hypothetical protein [Nocardiopsis gilva]